MTSRSLPTLREGLPTKKKSEPTDQLTGVGAGDASKNDAQSLKDQIKMTSS